MKNKNKELQRMSISSMKNLSQMDFIADDFAISDDFEGFQLFDFPIRVNDLIFGICLQGFIEIEINLKRYVLSTNCLVSILPEQTVRYIRQSDDFSIQFVIMSRTFLEDSQLGLPNTLPLFFSIKDNPCIHLTAEERDMILEYVALLKKKMRMTDTMLGKEIARNLLKALYYEGSEIFRQHLPNVKPAKSRKEETFSRFIELVERYCKQERSIGFYADKLCLTPKYLSTVIKQVSGKLAGEWIDDFTIQEAKVLLKSSNKTILQISEELNFVTQTRFGSYFKHFAGMSPKEYRGA
ncbi:MAG: helix-turn-helix domain-containing protein [Candidatus Symbiothrix sp.]|nr:helix-turn-helix domain-containing protein [Candidatus Symbiothrix sp.]